MYSKSTYTSSQPLTSSNKLCTSQYSIKPGSYIHNLQNLKYHKTDYSQTDILNLKLQANQFKAKYHSGQNAYFENKQCNFHNRINSDKYFDHQRKNKVIYGNKFYKEDKIRNMQRNIQKKYGYEHHWTQQRSDDYFSSKLRQPCSFRSYQNIMNQYGALRRQMPICTQTIIQSCDSAFNPRFTFNQISKNQNQELDKQIQPHQTGFFAKKQSLGDLNYNEQFALKDDCNFKQFQQIPQEPQNSLNFDPKHQTKISQESVYRGSIPFKISHHGKIYQMVPLSQTQ